MKQGSALLQQAVISIVKAKVPLRLTASQSVCLGVESGSHYCLTVTVVSLWGTLSDERPDLSFASQSLLHLVVCEYVHKHLQFIYLTHKFVYI
jgi:hypothetical protein